jgi:DNA-binding response OmpR family regulator
MMKRLLVVEAQEDLRAILSDFLSASGYTVIEAVVSRHTFVPTPKRPPTSSG